jgi:hypothetical protein
MRVLLLLLLSLSARAATNLFQGSIVQRDGQSFVRWTNCPAAVVLEYSTNLVTWYPSLILSTADGRPLVSFEYPLTNSFLPRNADAQAMRLRQVSVLAVP